MPGPSRPFLSRYLDGELADFFGIEPGDLTTPLQRELDRPRPALCAALAGEARRLGAPQPVFESLGKLEHPSSRVVVTGQQSGLLLGPAYTLSKAISAIRLASQLDSDDAPVVPVFWVASQDHDTAEIDHARLLDLDEELHTLRLDLPANVPAGHIPLRNEWLERLSAGMRGGRFVPEHLREVEELLGAAWERADGFADFFTAILYRLLGEQGLIILDPLRPAVAPLFRGVIEKELDGPLASVTAITAAGEALSEMGEQPQLGRGKDATNLFLTSEREGLPRRELLRFDGEVFYTGDRDYGPDELKGILCAEPWRVTPAAGLRPVAQDAVLPTAAFVVGPGELRYLAQLRGVYEHHGVPMPLVWPRASAVVLEPPVVRILRRHGLTYEQYVKERAGARDRVLLELHGHGSSVEECIAELADRYGRLTDSLGAIDPTLIPAVTKSREQIERSLARLEEKAALALARRDTVTSAQFARLEAQLFPAGIPQERSLSPFSFFLKFGVGPVLEAFLSLGTAGEHQLTI